MKIYVGNMSFDTTEEDLQQACAEFGKVVSAAIVKDKFSGQPKGFAFVEMSSVSEGQAAIAGLNGKELKGRELNVNEARPRTESFRGGSTGGFGGNQGGFGGGGSGKREFGGSRRSYGGNKGGGSKGGYGGGGKKGFAGGRGGRGR
ncbi:MAG: RNA-binding protein [Candidatus Scalindua sp.]|jgi:RNA recognition motif-containing protein|nr:RNA-binding protein [Candidatus Scalindua sp.]MBT5304930.1 RNA-binding protein [Candidatus Scalindua sp.]MBT6051676.1 RNA-binding protein [Candidatus Scalindua sp.]MBT6229175.1 RNA-binding protein [Candidatus Scalindua sp.]MBT6563877.1 RNA-binding protein [Candidatus Scalindua sp.]